MVRPRNAGKRILPFVGDFLRQMPPEAVTAVETFGEALPEVDVVAALARCDNDEVHAALAVHPPRQVAEYLGRIGVHARGTGPRQIGQMRVRLNQGLRAQDRGAVSLAHVMAEPTYLILLVRATDLVEDVPAGRINAAVDTATLRAFALAVALRLPDPSAPFVLAGMLESDDPALAQLYEDDEITEMRKGAEQLRADWRSEWTEPLQQWTRIRAQLDGPTTAADAAEAQPGSQHAEPPERPDAPAAPVDPGSSVTDTGAEDSAAERNEPGSLAPAQTAAAAHEAPPQAPAAANQEQPGQDQDAVHAPHVPALKDAHAAVTGSAEQVLAAVTARRPAKESDLAAIGSWSAAMRTAAAHVGAHPDSDLDTLQDAERLGRAQQEMRALLAELHSLAGPANLEDTLTELNALVSELIGSWTAQSVDDPSVHALLDLRELVLAAHSGDRDDDALLEQGLSLKKALPAQVNRLASAAALGRLILPPSTERSPGPTSEPDATAPASIGGETVPVPDASSELADGAGIQAVLTVDTGAPAADGGTQSASFPPGSRTPPPVTAPRVSAEPDTAHVQEASARRRRQPKTTTAGAPVTVTPTAAEAPASGDSTTSVATTVPVPPQPAASAAAPDVVAVQETAAAHLDLGPTTDAALVPQIIGTVDRLLIENRLGLAYEILHTAHAHTHADVVELAALANVLQGPGGPSGMYLCDMLDVLTEDDLRIDSACTLMSAAALVTAAIVAGSERAGQLLAGFAPHLDSAWGRLARLTADASITGALTGPALATPGDPARDLARDASAAAARRAGTAFTLRTPRSTKVLAALRSPDAAIGRALSVAANNDISQAETLAGELTALSTDGLEKSVKDADRGNRVSGKSLSPADQTEIIDTLLADRTAVLRWAEAATARSGADWTADRLAELRSHLLDHGHDLAAALGTYRDCAFGAGAAAVAQRTVDQLQAVVNGTATATVEPTPDTVLHLESLKTDGTRYDLGSGRVVSDQDRNSTEETLEALLAAVDERDFTGAVARRIAQDDFATALRCAEEISPEAAEEVRAAQDRRADALTDELHNQRLFLVRVRSGPAGVEEQDLLEAQLKQAEFLLQGSNRDIPTAAAALDDVRRQMGELREQAVSKLRAKIEELDGQQLLRPDERAQLLAKLDNDEFDAVDYELFYLERGEPIPDEGENILASFFPDAVTALSGGLTDELIAELSAGGAVGPISLPRGEENRTEIADALTRWTQLPEALRAGERHEKIRELLTPALRALGFELGPYSVQQLDVENARGRGRRLIGLNDARPIGRAIIPAFGSDAAGRYRLLLTWDKPTIDQLADWRELDSTGGAPLIICYFGTLSVEDRMRLSREWNDPAKRPAVIVDDAVLAFTAGSRREPFATLMHVTMPFSATAPYSAEKTARVPLEMFYGRERARRDIISLDGPSMIFGGRGMGKSAMLSFIQRRARANPSENLTVIWIELDRSPEFDEPEMIWVKLADALQAEGVTSPARVAQMRPENRVERLVGDYLAANQATRLLLLIDEADAFFSADARREYRQTSRLFKLANSTDRCKVVFAGLHGVAHHHGVGNNPFSPSGALPIGPLDRGDAYRLLTRPVRTLGYETGLDEANLILMHCNNQPYLIQLFAARLTDRLLRSRGRTDVHLPRPVPRQVIEAVLGDSHLREQIHRAFKITLDLDPRFSVIVHLLAQYAYQHGQVPLGEADLLEQCRLAWPAGFAGTTFASFRELLSELEALGMLGPAEPTRGGRMLRSTAVLESLGTREHIQINLDEITATALPEADARLQFRPSIGEEGRPGPLNSAQLADLAGRPGNRVRIVVGTELSGLNQVLDSLQDPVHKPVLRDVRVTLQKGEYRELLRAGSKSEKRLTVVSPLHHLVTASASCETALQTAEQLLPTEQDHFRAVVLTCGPANADWLWEKAAGPDIDTLVVPLERLNASTLKLHWREASPKVSPLGAELAERTLQLTGGWPGLVDQVNVRARRTGAERALDELEQQQQQPEWAGQLLTQAGVLDDPADTVGVSDGRLLRVVRLVADLGPCSFTDLRELAPDFAVDEASLTLATWFGLLAGTDDGQTSLAPLIGSAWERWTAERSVADS